MLESLMRHGTINIDKILQDLPACSRQGIEDFISAEKQQQVKKNYFHLVMKIINNSKNYKHNLLFAKTLCTTNYKQLRITK
jgi:hypothetical protein